MDFCYSPRRYQKINKRISPFSRAAAECGGKKLQLLMNVDFYFKSITKELIEKKLSKFDNKKVSKML